MSRGLKSITFGGHLSEDIPISARDLIFESIPTSSLKISLSKTFQGWPARPTGCAMSAFGGGNAGGLGPSSVCSWKGQIHPTTRTVKKTKTKNTVQRPPQVRTINPIKTHCDLEWNKPTSLRQEAYGCDRFYEMNKETYCWKGLQGIVPFRNSTMIPICFFPEWATLRSSQTWNVSTSISTVIYLFLVNQQQKKRRVSQQSLISFFIIPESTGANFRRKTLSRSSWPRRIFVANLGNV